MNTPLRSTHVKGDPDTMPDRDDNLAALDLLDGAEQGFTLSVLDSSPDCIKLLELDGTLSFMNSNGMCAMEIDDFDQVRGASWPVMWPQDSHDALADAMAEARSGRTQRFEAYCPTAKGTPRWWDVTVSPVRLADGTVARILAASRDVTDIVTAREQLREQAALLRAEVALKNAALARQKVLLGEIDHRVKNSFASVIALLRMQARIHADVEAGALIGDAANRITTLSRVHEQLHLDPESGFVTLAHYVAALTQDLGQALNAQVEFANDVPNAVRVNPSQAAAIGQLLAELIGNAVKHGGKDRRTTVWVEASAQGERLRLRVMDDGPGLPADFDPDDASGLGMQICQIYAQQMGGSMTHGASPAGGAAFDVDILRDATSVGFT
ncbi:sensor histidine kinase [Paracoccus indicus]|uniref:sensor histidine kinase n=1 Tax=Paracoccus indicus TaxID=2079229 RepID=UPI000D39901A|nr:PAS domain-containing protein [Paracoccus indicus]